MLKEKYETPEIEIVELDSKDIICTSGFSTEDDNDF